MKVEYKMNQRNVKSQSNEITIVHIYLNSLRNKFDILMNGVTGYIEILMISETKVDDIFLQNMYHLQGFSNPY